MNRDSSQSFPGSGADVLVSHSGKQHAYRHALSLHRLGRLAQLVTSSYYKPDRWPDKLIAKSARLNAWLGKRTLAGIPSAKVTRRWRYELPEIVCRSLVGNGPLADRSVLRRDANFDRWVATRFARQCPVFWGFQGSCLESLSAARAAGRVAVLELATAHVTMAERVLREEAERHPEWAATISNFDFPPWYHERLEQEPHRADRCVVASQFTRRSLQEVGIPDERITTLPLGADVELFQFKRRTIEGPLRVLFVGGIGQRKGIKYLLEAIKQLASSNIELVLVGPLPAEASPLDAYRNHFQYHGKLNQAGVVQEMQAADVLVLPSVFEGFGLVIPEAMATGMPVIASTHSAGPEMITEGVDGFIMEPSDVETLASHLDTLAKDRERAVEMGIRAAESARRFSWDTHARRLGEILESWQ